MSNCFPDIYRLKKPIEFLPLRTNPQVYSCVYFRVFYLKNSLDYPRLGIGVSTKVGHSVKRNLLKRITRESFRHSRFNIKSVDMLISYNPNFFNSKHKLDRDLVLSINQNLNHFFSLIQRINCIN